MNKSMIKKTTVQKKERIFMHKISTSKYKEDILLKVRQLAYNEKKTIEAQILAMKTSKNGFYSHLKGKSEISIDWLERFALIHNVPITYFTCQKEYEADQKSDQVNEKETEYDIIDNITTNLNKLLKSVKFKADHAVMELRLGDENEAKNESKPKQY